MRSAPVWPVVAKTERHQPLAGSRRFVPAAEEFGWGARMKRSWRKPMTSPSSASHCGMGGMALVPTTSQRTASSQFAGRLRHDSSWIEIPHDHRNFQAEKYSIASRKQADIL